MINPIQGESVNELAAIMNTNKSAGDNEKVTVVVIAKECIPGKVKTRLHPPLTLEEAAELAAASIQDTLKTMAALPAARYILLYDGVKLPPNTENYEVMPQVPGGLDERLAAMLDQVDGPVMFIGMDTPQVQVKDLAPVFGRWPDNVDGWFGPANDGGYWTLALRNPSKDNVLGVPMSQDDTGLKQLERLAEQGLNIRMLNELVDVDTIVDAKQVAWLAPASLFAQTLIKHLR